MCRYIVDLHRQLSDLAYCPIESVARCAPPAPPPINTDSSTEDRNLHTSKALLAIRRLGDLIPLPPNIVQHTPFLICMIANTMVAHLSACRYLFRNRTLQLERERIRSCMGALRLLGEHWLLGKRTYREMGIIAREILSLTEESIPRGWPPQETSQPPSMQPSTSEESMQYHAETQSSDADSGPETMPGMSLDFSPACMDFENLSQSLFDAYGGLLFPLTESVNVPM